MTRFRPTGRYFISLGVNNTQRKQQLLKTITTFILSIKKSHKNKIICEQKLPIFKNLDFYSSKIQIIFMIEKIFTSD